MRFYSEIGKKSKNNIDLAGENIYGIDSTKAKDWVIWTTKNYICVINTVFKDTEGVTQDAFKKTITKVMREKHMPIMILKLLDEEFKTMGITENEVHFTPAKFDNGPVRSTTLTTHKYITTSTGKTFSTID